MSTPEDISNRLHALWATDIPNDGTYTLDLDEQQTEKFFEELDEQITSLKAQCDLYLAERDSDRALWEKQAKLAGEWEARALVAEAQVEKSAKAYFEVNAERHTAQAEARSLREALRENAISARIIAAENSQRGQIQAIARDAKFIENRANAALAAPGGTEGTP